jgi:hypothetical protein
MILRLRILPTKSAIIFVRENKSQVWTWIDAFCGKLKYGIYLFNILLKIFII